MTLKLVRTHDQAMVVSDGRIADTFLPRLVGLIGTKSFPAGKGVLFPRCNDIHMWMMSIPIDVVFLKSNASTQSAQSWEVLKVCENVKPWRPLPLICFKADDTLELPSGTISKWNLKAGEVLCIAS